MDDTSRCSETDSEGLLWADAEPDGEAFLITCCAERETGISAISLPATTYGATFVVSMACNQPLAERIAFELPIILGVVVTLLFQVVVTYGVMVTVQSNEAPTCESGDRLVRLCCVTVFLFSALNDMVETLDLFRWLQRIPHAVKSETLQLRQFTKDYPAQPDTPFKRSASVCKAVTGITKLHRSLLMGLLIMPKFLMVACLAYYGSPYVLHAEGNESLVLNSVALVFIVDIDDIIFAFTSTSEIKKVMDSLPPLGLFEEEVKPMSANWWFEVLWPLSSYMFSSGLVFFMEAHWCGL